MQTRSNRTCITRESDVGCKNAITSSRQELTQLGMLQTVGPGQPPRYNAWPSCTPPFSSFGCCTRHQMKGIVTSTLNSAFFFQLFKCRTIIVGFYILITPNERETVILLVLGNTCFIYNNIAACAHYCCRWCLHPGLHSSCHPGTFHQFRDMCRGRTESKGETGHVSTSFRTCTAQKSWNGAFGCSCNEGKGCGFAHLKLPGCEVVV